MPARREILRVRLGDALVDDPGGRAVEGSCQCGSLARGGTIRARHDASLVMARGMRPTGGFSHTPAGRQALRSEERGAWRQQTAARTFCWAAAVCTCGTSTGSTSTWTGGTAAARDESMVQPPERLRLRCILCYRVPPVPTDAGPDHGITGTVDRLLKGEPSTIFVL